MFCGKCGVEIPDGYEYCMKCGTKLDAPITKEEAKSSKMGIKKLIPVIAIMALLLIGVFFLFIKGGSEDEGFFLEIPWGVDMKTANKLLRNYDVFFIYNDEDSMALQVKNYDGKKGVTITPVLTFKDNRFNEVITPVTIEDDSSYTSASLTKELEDEFTKKYGEPVDDNGVTITWETAKSKIKLSSLPAGLIEDSIFISYTEKTE